MKNGISVLICTHNSSRRIEKTLSYLIKQKVRSAIPWEIVLVDNASTDGTGEIVNKFWDSEVPLWIICEPRLGVAYARITGIRKCRFSYIAIVDDDNWVPENWVETAYDAMESHPEACAIGGPSEAVFETPAPEWFPRYSRNYAVGEQYDKPGLISDEKLLWGAGLIIRKEALDILAGIGFEPVHESRKGHALLSGEETEVLLLFKLMGFSSYYNPELKIQHYMPNHRLQWRYFLRLKKALGASSVYLDAYRSVIDCIHRGVKPNPDPWLKGIFESLGMTLRDPLALLAGLFLIKQGNFRVANACFHLGRFIQKFKLGSDYEILQDVLYNKYASLLNAWKNNKST